jgi:hypothetical protein
VLSANETLHILNNLYLTCLLLCFVTLLMVSSAIRKRDVGGDDEKHTTWGLRLFCQARSPGTVENLVDACGEEENALSK